MRKETRGPWPHRPTSRRRRAGRVRVGGAAALVAFLATACVEDPLEPIEHAEEAQLAADQEAHETSVPDGTIEAEEFEWISPGAPATGNDHALRLTDNGGVNPGFEFEAEDDLTIDFHWRFHSGDQLAYMWDDQITFFTGFRAFTNGVADSGIAFRNPFGGDDIDVEGDYQDGEWYHIRVVLDSSEGTFTVYIDGEEMGRTSYDGRGFSASDQFRVMGREMGETSMADYDRMVWATEAIHDPEEEVISDVLHYELEDGEGDVVTNAASASDEEDLEIVTEELPEWTVDHPGYEAELEAEGGTAPHSWELVDGELPSGLTLEEDGTIHGDPTGAQTADFTVRVTGGSAASADRDLSITVNPPPVIRTGGLLPAVAGERYSHDLEAEQGTGQLRWGVAQGELPAGLKLDPTTGELIEVGGTPRDGGSYQVTVEVSDDLGVSDEREYLIRVGQCADLVANRQQNGAGQVCVVGDGESLHVTYEADNGGLLTETRLAVSADEPGQGEWTDAHPSVRWQNPEGHPLPERFPHGGQHEPGTESVSYRIPLSDISGGVEPGEPLYVAAFAETNSRQAREAWAEGERFRDPGHWATYFVHSQE